LQFDPGENNWGEEGKSKLLNNSWEKSQAPKINIEDRFQVFPGIVILLHQPLGP